VPDHVEELRRIAAETEPAPAAMEAYLAKVRDGAYTVTDADVEGLKAEGFSEDEIFEQTVATAIQAGLRRLDAAERAIGVEAAEGVAG
jgi:alkylhydroperoxidase family enzyme